ncbi:MAG: FAD-binding oxidoreductase [Bdellovibrionales bacterium]|nr:FAD-binding oxidoreductase [Bdellovibrionales bacterium]
MIDLAPFLEVLEESGVSESPEDLDHYGKDSCKEYRGHPRAILFPRSVEQVQKIVRICAANSYPLVPSGGRTGYSGGATAIGSELVLSLDRLNKIHSIDPIERTVRCQAGVITEKLQNYASDHGLYFPLDFASKGSSQIGGNIATNAGGIHVVRYGLTRNWVRGLKVVLANGELLDLDGGLIKDQTGYDLKNLFIGSEGTLGIIVEATLQLTIPPGPQRVLFCGVEKLESAISLLSLIRKENFLLSAFECLSRNALELVTKHTNLSDPFNTAYPFYLLIELEQVGTDFDGKIEKLFTAAVESNFISDAILSQSEKQAKELWGIRERISETLGANFTPHKNDISVAVQSIPSFLSELQSHIKSKYPDFVVVIFGHIGDGNLHVNFLKPQSMELSDFIAKCKETDAELFKLVKQFRGSVSAEHGVGLLKRDFLSYSRSEIEISVMRQIKLTLDPLNILNPGKIFPT